MLALYTTAHSLYLSFTCFASGFALLVQNGLNEPLVFLFRYQRKKGEGEKGEGRRGRTRTRRKAGAKNTHIHTKGRGQSSQGTKKKKKERKKKTCVQMQESIKEATIPKRNERNQGPAKEQKYTQRGGDPMKVSRSIRPTVPQGHTLLLSWERKLLNGFAGQLQHFHEP